MSQKDSESMIQSLWGKIRDIQARLNQFGQGTTVGAVNGLSTSIDKVVLGQDISQGGDPAILTSNREIPMSTFTLRLRDATNTNHNVLGPGTLVSTRVSGGTNITGTNTITTNTNINGASLNTTVTLGSFTNFTGGAYPFIGVKRFNTVTGSTITTTTSNRQSVFYGAMQFENDVAANNNAITLAGPVPVSVFASKIDFWPGASNQNKTVTGAIASYNTFFDASSVVNSSLETLVDYQAGSLSGTATFTITNRYGFRVLDLGASVTSITNKWAFAQEGVGDRNWFAGFSGFGLNNATARVHVAAGTATIAPIILNPGVVLTTPVNGALETDGTNLYFTVGGVRKTVTLV